MVQNSFITTEVEYASMSSIFLVTRLWRGGNKILLSHLICYHAIIAVAGHWICKFDWSDRTEDSKSVARDLSGTIVH